MTRLLSLWRSCFHRSRGRVEAEHAGYRLVATQDCTYAVGDLDMRHSSALRIGGRQSMVGASGGIAEGEVIAAPLVPSSQQSSRLAGSPRLASREPSFRLELRALALLPRLPAPTRARTSSVPGRRDKPKLGPPSRLGFPVVLRQPYSLRAPLTCFAFDVARLTVVTFESPATWSRAARRSGARFQKARAKRPAE